MIEIKGTLGSVKLEKKDIALFDYPQQLRELHYEATTNSLIKNGLWAYKAITFYFEPYPESHMDEFEIYRGMWFRYDLIGNNIELAINPITGK